VCRSADRRPDSVFDCSRILRPPGTLNFKYNPPRVVRIAWLEPERRYTLDGIEDYLRQHHPWALQPRNHRTTTPPPCPPAHASPPARPERAARGPTRRSTLALLNSVGPADYNSPSEADAAIAAGLIGAGLTEAEVMTLIMDSARGQDALQRKGERHG